MFRFLPCLVVLAGLLASGAAAQDRQKGEEACGRDAARYCKAVLNDGDYAVLNCLKANRARLRAVCVKQLQEHGQLN